MDLRQAINQIMRYKKHSYIGLYRYIQCFVVSNGVDTKYFANSDKDILYSLTFFWTDENNIRVTNLKEFSIAFFAKDALTRLLIRYTVLKAVMIMRPYQVYAASKLIDRARFSDKNAYVWHTTGSGARGKQNGCKHENNKNNSIIVPSKRFIALPLHLPAAECTTLDTSAYNLFYRKTYILMSTK